MSRLCRLKSYKNIGEDGEWAYHEITNLRAQLAEAEKERDEWKDRFCRATYQKVDAVTEIGIELATTRAKFDAINKDFSDLEDQLAAAQAENNRLTEQCRDYAAQAETDQGIIKSDGKEIHFLRVQLAAAQAELAEVKAWKEASNTLIEELNAEISSLKAEAEHLHLINSALCDTVEKLDKELADYKEIQKASEKQFWALSNEIMELKAELERLSFLIQYVKPYEELRALLDGGSESMTHEDAVAELKRIIAGDERSHNPRAQLEEAQAELAEVKYERDVYHESWCRDGQELDSLKAGRGEPVAHIVKTEDGEELAYSAAIFKYRMFNPDDIIADLYTEPPPKAEPSGEPELISYGLDLETCTLKYKGEEYSFGLELCTDGKRQSLLNWQEKPTANQIRAEAFNMAADMCYTIASQYRDYSCELAAKDCTEQLRAEAAKLREM